jgi:hypothetical protein
MDVRTLLPYNGSKRTGRLYDHPPEDGGDVGTSLSGKLLLWHDESRKLIQLRLWTAEAGFWTQIVLDPSTHGIVATASAEAESDAWSYLARALKLKGYAI